jgi:hypothetical protein
MDIFDYKYNDKIAAVYIHGRILSFYHGTKRLALFFLDHFPRLGHLKHIYTSPSKTLCFFKYGTL